MVSYYIHSYPFFSIVYSFFAVRLKLICKCNKNCFIMIKHD
ncbi:hypothetical protein NBRC111894_1779 [Sporolactobacillus inulinus]|uniref:Uncharacterized protein n=1 Tax=Sporolactobacillus inulinus TaxID=2078 RepID=A0A4Y1ZB07_9BACL|nr:hypothetical protein NBRC111894_1779 [Sporolactobacillus inulinus]